MCISINIKKPPGVWHLALVRHDEWNYWSFELLFAEITFFLLTVSCLLVKKHIDKDHFCNICYSWVHQECCGEVNISEPRIANHRETVAYLTGCTENTTKQGPQIIISSDFVPYEQSTKKCKIQTNIECLEKLDLK